jgi:hypothetical protein
LQGAIGANFNLVHLSFCDAGWRRGAIERLLLRCTGKLKEAA